jgi:hypothetical protein
MTGFVGIELALLVMLLTSSQAWVRALAVATITFVVLFGWLLRSFYLRQLQENQKTAKLLHEAISSVAQGFTIYDQDDRLVQCNEAYLQFYEASRDLIVPGATFEQIVRAGAERGQYREAIGQVDEWVRNRVVQHQKANGEVIEQQLADGRWLLIVEYRTPSGYIAGNRIDITALKDTQASLSQRELYLRATLDNLPFLFWLKDADSRFLAVNKVFSDACGRANPADVAGLTDLDVWPPELAQAYRADDFAVMRSRQEKSLEEPVAGSNGANWLETYKKPVIAADGSLLGTVGFARDISARKQMQQDLIANEQRWELAVSSTNDGIWDWNPRTGQVYFSERWKTMLGYADDEIGTRVEEWSERVHPDDMATTMAQLQLHLNGDIAFYQSEHRMRCKDGSYKWILARGIAVDSDAAGKPTRIIGTHTDVTARKQAELELAQHRDHLEDLVSSRTAELSLARDVAEAANRAKTAFLANMSHELRTPMNGIMGMINLAMRGAVDQRQRDQLGKSLSAAEHLTDIINDILDLSKIEAERLDLEHSDFALAELIEASVAIQEPVAREKGLELTCRIEPSLPQRVTGDPLRLRQILLNFISNAVKFSQHGNIAVRTSVAEQDATGILLRIEVSDQGIGISQEQQARLFQAFSQVDESSTRRYGGTGLGLVISRRIAQLMGGDAGVSSELGAGSRFWATVRLAIAEGDAGSERAPVADAAAELRREFAGRRVLVAEDEALSRDVACALLEGAGLVPVLAENGAQAVETASRGGVVAVLMDMQMPVMGGCDAARAIRVLPGMAAIPILAMTANAFDDDREQCLRAGMNDHITKPVMPDAFYRCLLSWLRHAAAPGSANPA